MEDGHWVHSLIDALGLGEISGLERGGYLDAMLANTPSLYYCALALSFGALTVAWLASERAASRRKEEKRKKREKRSNEKLGKKKSEGAKKEEVVKEELAEKKEVSVSETRPLKIEKKVVENSNGASKGSSNNADETVKDSLSKFRNIYPANVDGDATEKEPETYELNGHTYTKFEICADDECTFTPFTSVEEDKAYCAQFQNTKYVPLDKDQPDLQVNAFVDRINGQIVKKNSDDDEEESDIEATEEELEAARKFVPEDYRQYLTEKEMTVLDDPRESPSRRGTIIERVKKARKRYIRKQLEKGMNAEDHVKEKMAETQCIARVWQIMKDDPAFEGMTLDDVKKQFAMYN